MAMGQRGRREAEHAIACCRPFSNSTGSMTGTRGSTRNLGWLSNHQDARRLRELLSRATYIVWSYDTPIAFVTEDETGNIQKFFVDESHSATTANHQAIARMGMGEYETIGERRPARRPRANRQDPIIPGADCGDGTPPDRTDFEPIPETNYTSVATEDRARASLAQLLDSRYGDPDWTPWGRHGGLPEGADERDAQRIAAEGPWRP